MAVETQRVMTVVDIIVEENPTDGIARECCPLCGSVGVVHFEDRDTTPMQHRCLRCNGGWDGCMVSEDETLSERLSNSKQRQPK